MTGKKKPERFSYKSFSVSPVCFDTFRSTYCSSSAMQAVACSCAFVSCLLIISRHVNNKCFSILLLKYTPSDVRGSGLCFWGGKVISIKLHSKIYYCNFTVNQWLIIAVIYIILFFYRIIV